MSVVLLSLLAWRAAALAVWLAIAVVAAEVVMHILRPPHHHHHHGHHARR